MLGLGGSIGFYQGDTRRIQDDVIQLKPSVFCSVPRLLTKFFVEVSMSTISIVFKIFFFSYNVDIYYIKDYSIDRQLTYQKTRTIRSSFYTKRKGYCQVHIKKIIFSVFFLRYLLLNINSI